MASCSRRADEWNVREVLVWSRGEGVVDVWRKARIEGVRILEAMVWRKGGWRGGVLVAMYGGYVGKGVAENMSVEKSVGF